MSRYQLRQGIIIRRQVQPSGDVLVTVLSPAEENYPIKWRGIARKGQKLGGNIARLNLFHDISAQIYQKPQQEIATLTQVILNGALARLSEPQRYNCAHVVAELVDALSSEDSAHHFRFYDYFTSALRGIAQHEQPEKIALIYSWRLLAQAGLAPNVAGCAQCGAKCGAKCGAREDSSTILTHLHIEAGGLSCQRCENGLALPREVVQEISLLHQQSVARAIHLPFHNRSAHWRALSRYISYHVQDLRSLANLRP